MTHLDWRDKRHWGGKPKPCRICGRSTLLLDANGEPCHKTRAEREAT